jgi:hypothetical protein
MLDLFYIVTHYHELQRRKLEASYVTWYLLMIVSYHHYSNWFHIYPSQEDISSDPKGRGADSSHVIRSRGHFGPQCVNFKSLYSVGQAFGGIIKSCGGRLRLFILSTYVQRGQRIVT